MSADPYAQGAFLFGGSTRARGRTRRASDNAVKALRAGGRLEVVDDAVVVGVRVAADNVDAAERARHQGDATTFMVANAVRTYLAAVAMLYARTGMLEPADDDDLMRLMAAAPPSG
jgi:hypothetical protein